MDINNFQLGFIFHQPSFWFLLQSSASVSDKRNGKNYDFQSAIESFNYMINNVFMNNIDKMLSAIINGQSALKSELLVKIDGVDQKVDKLDSKIDGVEKRLTKRIDKLGKQTAYLEDDAPTREEHDKLDERVEKLEQKIVAI